jgi:glycosyltransferase involved in cell wall biosynthesis
MHVDICVPAYNEALILEASTEQLYNFCKTNLTNLDWQIVLVINGSNDNSPAIARELEKKYPCLSVVVFKQGGRGQALKKYWLDSKAEIVAYMDSDLAVNLEALPRLLSPLINNKADLVIGNRYDKKSLLKRSFFRNLSSYLYNLIAKSLFNYKQKDLQCGFKAIKKSVFEKLADKTNDPGWFFDAELIIWAEKLNFKVLGIYVNWQENRLGQRISKVRFFSTAFKLLKSFRLLKKQLKTSV